MACLPENVISSAELTGLKADIATIDSVVESALDTTTTKSGTVINTLEGQLKLLGYEPPVTYAGSIVFTTNDNTKTVEEAGVVYAPLPSALPFTTSGTFIGDDDARFFVVQGLTIDNFGLYGLRLEDTLAAAVASSELEDGDTLYIAGRVTKNDGGGAIWHAVLSASVTENTYNIVQCVGVPLISIVLDLDDVHALKWGVTNDGVDSEAAIQHFVNNNENPIFKAGLFHFGSGVTVPENRNTRVTGAGWGITRFIGDVSSNIFLQAGNDVLSFVTRGITFDGQVDRSGISFPYANSVAGAPKGASRAFTHTQVSDALIDMSECEFLNFFELPVGVFNNRNVVKFSNNRVYKCKDVGFVNCARVECNDNKVYFSHDNSLSLSRGNRNVTSLRNFIFSPEFVGIACYGFPIDDSPNPDIDEDGPEGFDISDNVIMFSGQANISNVRAPKNGSVSNNVMSYAGLYADSDTYQSTGSITTATAIMTVALAGPADTSKIVAIPRNTMADPFFAIISSGGGTTTLTLDRNAPDTLTDADVYLIQERFTSISGYIVSGTTDGTKRYAENITVTGNTIVGSQKVGANLGTNTGSVRDIIFSENMIVRTDDLFDGDAIGVLIDDVNDSSYRTSGVDVENNKIKMGGGLNTKGISYAPAVSNSQSSRCTARNNKITGTTDDNQLIFPGEYNPTGNIDENVTSLMVVKAFASDRQTISVTTSTLSADKYRVRMSAAAPINVTDIIHSYDGPQDVEFVLVNTGTNIITFVSDTAKIRLNTGANTDIGQYQSIRFIKVTDAIYQQIS